MSTGPDLYPHGKPRTHPLLTRVERTMWVRGIPQTEWRVVEREGPFFLPLYLALKLCDLDGFA